MDDTLIPAGDAFDIWVDGVLHVSFNCAWVFPDVLAILYTGLRPAVYGLCILPREDPNLRMANGRIAQAPQFYPLGVP